MPITAATGAIIKGRNDLVCPTTLPAASNPRIAITLCAPALQTRTKGCREGGGTQDRNPSPDTPVYCGCWQRIELSRYPTVSQLEYTTGSCLVPAGECLCPPKPSDATHHLGESLGIGYRIERMKKNSSLLQRSDGTDTGKAESDPICQVYPLKTRPSGQ